ncbi:hypothetical protein Dred_0110 [Desulforamulus reducens MI-1]|uniref:Uncharacterized protein n=1 Tax=Desulforamulus reducens (strain ATCC BAA-1160 / DSM 100696 / MI-1) TaxID=349161 RepID=A4J0Q7_DESRM|nr:hypothetical protein [Desulforamulus reducens]ABO48660.1 hypothetical protein Dred_0110 [Desulforamulus reducens MI-1]
MINSDPSTIYTVALAATMLAAGTSWVANGWGRNFFGNRGVTYFTPLVEEMSKTLWAVVLNTPLVWTHLGFGLIEALVEIKRRSVKGILAGCTSLIVHGMLGLLTVKIYTTSNLLFALLSSYLAHASWNGAVNYYSKRTDVT